MIVNLAEVRQHRTLHPRRNSTPRIRAGAIHCHWNSKKSERRIFSVRCDRMTGTRLPVFSATRLSVSPWSRAHICMRHSK
jgi:hypothetical protein